MKSYPLTWPTGWKRTADYRRGAGPFRDGRSRQDLTIAEAVDRIMRELRLMGVRDWNNPIISTNVELTLTGRPRSGSAQPKDPGVAVYWRTNSDQPHKVMALDRYSRVEQNLAAIAATLEAMRAIERHGGAAILERAFTGFTALPAPNTWKAVLGIPDEVTPLLDTVRNTFRVLSKQRHPDCGGSHAAMTELNWALAEAEKELRA